MPVLSIIIPTYNYGKFLAEAVDSALQQIAPSVDIEVIVVDDGSTDNTQEILEGYGDKILNIRTENRGVVHARNTGLKKMTGEFWCSLDADNILQPTFAETMVTHLIGQEATGFLYCDRTIFGDTEEHPVPGVDFDLESYRTKNYIDINTVVFRSSSTRGHWFDPTFNYSWDDYDFCMSLIEAGVICARLPNELVRYRVHGDSISAAFRKHARDRQIQRAFIRKHGHRYPRHTLQSVKNEYRNQELVRILNQRLPGRSLSARARDLFRFLSCRGPLDRLWGQILYTLMPGKMTK